MTELAKFTKQTLVFSLPFILLTVCCAIYFPFYSKSNFQFEFLYHYQLQKIKNNLNYDTIFIGDSSLGYAIDADLFSDYTSKSALNLALTGDYGYAGSYNVLKRVYRENPSIKNVIIMQTLDMSLRKTSYLGYLYTISDFSDIWELNIFEKIQLFKLMINVSKMRGQFKELVFSYVKGIFAMDQKKRHLNIVNDYIRQGRKISPKKPNSGFSPEKIDPDKYRFLEKIARYVENNGLNLVYLHGPLFDSKAELSSLYVKEINENIQTVGINLIEEVVRIPLQDIGNVTDHVDPEKKKLYTIKFIELIESNKLFMRRLFENK